MRRNDPFQGCTLLQVKDERLGTIAVVDRFATLPIYKACYHLKHTKLSSILAEMDRNGDALVDAHGMTPFHILATSAMLRTDLLGGLIDEYSMASISQKDSHGKMMMDYLLANRSSKAPSIIKLVLGRIFDAEISGWGLPKWKSILCGEIESSECWEGDMQSRLRCLHGLYERLFVYRKVEQMSLLELAAWKIRMGSGEVDRECYRLICGSDAVIGNVKWYLSRAPHDQS
ncbi:unnamed protein product [Cylindrotheca closterium]|uniref:Uncharacterized protein n=1 Tax=Cylindrotheca closterium TaxID=2856 RepID=A0AAD2FT62_9STRA|nr:unnamed protein product [Cylindrotheca closterium]